MTEEIDFHALAAILEKYDDACLMRSSMRCICTNLGMSTKPGIDKDLVQAQNFAEVMQVFEKSQYGERIVSDTLAKALQFAKTEEEVATVASLARHEHCEITLRRASLLKLWSLTNKIPLQTA